ncbi:MAG TPA: adenylate/guanylate cyclase domain-containing protein [Candidatus Didemnitutus sp.]|jgi:class 3 adenylate cyclase
MNSRILLIEDEPANIATLSSILRDKGYQTSIATSGEQGLELLGRVRPDLILLDIMMGGIDGFETCRRIKADSEWRNIPVIFLTARTETADIVRGFETGAVDYVAKPFHAHELLARVHTHLSLDHLHRENERLLLNILPAPIAEKLKKQTGIIAERFDDVSVLFADLVGFTPYSARLTPVQLLEMLNGIFSGFDQLAERHGLEKIKTIGDSYMVAGGLPDPHPDHLAAMATFALEMLERVRATNFISGGLDLRIGLHTGSVIAGVIGIRKFIYDVWGDTVNTASRLESHGMPGRVQVSDTVYERLKDRFDFTSRGVIELRGRGPMNTYFLSGTRGAKVT